MKTKLHKRPMRDGLWHPVDANGVVGWPVEVNILRSEDGKRHLHFYHYGREESYELRDWKPGTLWLRYRTPKVTP